ncbi:MAG: hypothetical protein JWO05_726 [Gemmatimonadetes bacterium]|nr:hypothetical protein [Gemmatimonadota bacterium]
MFGVMFLPIAIFFLKIDARRNWPNALGLVIAALWGFVIAFRSADFEWMEASANPHADDAEPFELPELPASPPALELPQAEVPADEEAP